VYHLNAVKAMTTPQNDIGDMLSKKHHEDKVLNGRMLMNIMQNLQCLGRQGIPLRGHNDKESNFIQLLKLRSHDQQVIKLLRDCNFKCIYHR